VRKQCAVCSAEFEAKRKTAKYCSRRCSMRASRQPKAEADAVMPVDPDSELWTATLDELTSAGRVASSSGQAALILARRIDSASGETGSGLAALVKQHGASLADALKGARAESNPLDELRARRERKLDAG
jgi:hypothetical protein